MVVRSYADLDVWKKGVDLVLAVYRATGEFPRDEVFGLTSQLRRAAVSIPSNIAEGQSRRSSAEFRRHLSIALGSLAELETQLVIAKHLGYLGSDQHTALLAAANEVGRMLSGLLRAIAPTTRSSRGPSE